MVQYRAGLCDADPTHLRECNEPQLGHILPWLGAEVVTICVATRVLQRSQQGAMTPGVGGVLRTELQANSADTLIGSHMGLAQPH